MYILYIYNIYIYIYIYIFNKGRTIEYGNCETTLPLEYLCSINISKA